MKVFHVHLSSFSELESALGEQNNDSTPILYYFSTKLYKKLCKVLDDLEYLIIIVGTFMRNFYESTKTRIIDCYIWTSMRNLYGSIVQITSSRRPVLYVDNPNVPATNRMPTSWGDEHGKDRFSKG